MLGDSVSGVNILLGLQIVIFLLCPHMVVGKRELSEFNIIRALISTMRALPSRPNHLSKALPQIPSIVNQVSAYEFWGKQTFILQYLNKYFCLFYSFRTVSRDFKHLKKKIHPLWLIHREEGPQSSLHHQLKYPTGYAYFKHWYLVANCFPEKLLQKSFTTQHIQQQVIRIHNSHSFASIKCYKEIQSLPISYAKNSSHFYVQNLDSLH